eukprot:TsM_000134900 transcript=TsM_000134900 gene=TsM_000134900
MRFLLSCKITQDWKTGVSSDHHALVYAVLNLYEFVVDSAFKSALDTGIVSSRVSSFFPISEGSIHLEALNSLQDRFRTPGRKYRPLRRICTSHLSISSEFIHLKHRKSLKFVAQSTFNLDATMSMATDVIPMEEGDRLFHLAMRPPAVPPKETFP